MQPNYKEGDLVIIQSYEGMTLCRVVLRGQPGELREIPTADLKTYSYHTDNIFKSLEGKLGLVVYVAKNRLEQSLGYRVLIEGQEMFCKSKVASKYFKLLENQGDEGR
jgi:hypothetical protein